MNDLRDGSNQRLVVAFSRAATGGNIVLTVYSSYSGAKQDITLTPTITDGVLDVDATCVAFRDALNAATSLLGTAWGTAGWGDDMGPIVVSDISYEMVAGSTSPYGRNGTPWEITDNHGKLFDGTKQYVFEITFQGSVHDMPVYVELKSSALTTATGTTGAILTTETDGDPGTLQHDTSIAMQSNGTFVTAYTQDNLYTDHDRYSYGYYVDSYSDSYSQTIFVRTFNESTDTAGPSLTGLEALQTVNGIQALGQVYSDPAQPMNVSTSTGVPYLVLDFSEALHAVGNVDQQLAAMGLTQKTATGAQLANCQTSWAQSALNPTCYDVQYYDKQLQQWFSLSNAVTSVQYGLNEAALVGLSAVGTNKYQVVLTLGQGLASGSYRVVAKHYVAGSQAGVCDAMLNPLGTTGFFPGGADALFDFAVDYAPPTVVSINRAAASADTTATSVQYIVTFGEDVTGVDAQYFALETTGSVSGTIASVTGSGNVYTVTVGSLAGTGTLGLDLLDDDSITSVMSGKPLGGNGGVGTDGDGTFYGQSYNATDVTPPTVVSINCHDASTTNATSVQFDVTFSENVTGVQASDFTPVVTGITWTNRTVTGGGNTYLVTISGISGQGTLGLNLIDHDTIKDVVANPLGALVNGVPIPGDGGFTGQIYTIDTVPPYVKSITLDNPTNATTNAANLTFQVTFSEAVTIDASYLTNEFVLASTGNAKVTGGFAYSASLDKTTYYVTLTGVAGDGTIGLNLVDHNHITDLAGNPLGTLVNGVPAAGDGSVIGPLYTVDHTSPTVVSISRHTATPTNFASVQFDITFSESVNNVVASDFIPMPGSGVTWATKSFSGSGTSYTVTIGGISGDGTLGLNLNDPSGTILDPASNKVGNLVSGTYTGQTYTIDNTAPTVASMTRHSSNALTNASSVQFDVTFKESVLGVDASTFVPVATGTVATSPIVTVTGSGTSYTVTVSGITGDGTLGLNLVDNDTIKDLAGNVLGGPGAGNGNFTGQTYTVDHTPPVVASISRHNTNPTNAKTLQYDVAFSENVSNVAVVDFKVVPSGTAAWKTVSLSGSGSTYTITVDGVSGDGTLRLDLSDDDSIIDAATNKLGGTGTSGTAGDGSFTGQSYTIDNTPPTVLSIARHGAALTNASTVQYDVTFSESVSGIDSTDFALSTTGTIAVTALPTGSGNGSTYAVIISGIVGDGTLRLDLKDNDTIVDAAGNKLGGTGTSGATDGSLAGQTYTIDETPPTVTSVTRVGVSPTNATTVAYNVTFSENVTGVDTSDFTLAKTGTASGKIATVSGSGSTYTVTVTGVSGDGTLRLDLKDDDSIIDAAANKLGGAGLGSGDFTSGQSYAVDHTPPAVVSILPNDANPTKATSVVFNVAFSETVTGVGLSDFALAKTGTATGSIASVTGSGTYYTVTVTGVSGSGDIGLNLVDDDSILDTAVNPLGGTGTGNGNFTGQTYTIDNTPPKVSAINRDDSDPISAASLHYDVIFSENVTNVVASDFAMIKTDTVTGSIASLTGSGNTYTVTVNGV
jgi:hypothetical protein